MFAVLKTGGKQHKVKTGDLLRVEKIFADAGETVQFNDVLMLGGEKPVVGAPLVDGAAVQALVVDQLKGEKTVNFVKRRRKHGSQRAKGHRQKLTLIKISEIISKGADKSGVKLAVGRDVAETKPINKNIASGAQPETAASLSVDDLTKLSGVGPAMMKKLNSAGIKSFSQIATLSPENAKELDKNLSLKGRIEREGWIEQSKKLFDKG